MRRWVTVWGVVFAAAAAQAQVEQVPLFDLRGHRQAVRQIIFLPDGKRLVSIADAGPARVWDLKTHETIRRLMPPQAVRIEGSLNLLPSRKVERIALLHTRPELVEAVTERDRRSVVRLWDLDQGRELRVLFESRAPVRALAVSPDDRLVATNASDVRRFVQYIVLRNIRDGKVVAQMEEKRLAPVRLAFSPDGKWLVAAGSRRLHFWDVAARKLVHRDDAAHKRAIQDMVISRDGKLLVTGSTDDTVRLWDVEQGKRIREIEAEQDGVYSVALSPSGRTVITGGGDHTTKLWSAASGKHRRTLWGHIARVTALAVSPDGAYLATGSRDGTISIWKFEEPAADEDETEDADSAP